MRLTGRLTCANMAEADIPRAHLPGHVRLTRAEPGCVAVEVRRIGETPIWAVAEEFRDPEAFRQHQARTRASAWGRATAGI
ncbi:MAG: putative quinol monooxygenase, partial [Tranquillimonas sp.]